MSYPKQVIVVRKDLKMRKGKMIAQGAHASMKVFLDRSLPPLVSVLDTGNPSPLVLSIFQNLIRNIALWSLRKVYHSEILIIPLTDGMDSWVSNSFTKIAVSVDSELELLDIYHEALNAKIPCAIIMDAGKTEFGGTPTLTAVAIGPDYPEKIDPITGRLKLL